MLVVGDNRSSATPGGYFLIIHSFHRANVEPDSGGVTPLGMATAIELLSIDETADLLATILAGVAGGTKARWRKLVQIEPLPAWQFVRFNWRLRLAGDVKEREALDRAMAVVRKEHPYIAY